MFAVIEKDLKHQLMCIHTYISSNILQKYLSLLKGRYILKCHRLNISLLKLYISNNINFRQLKFVHKVEIV